MTEQELDILAQDSSRELIERHIGEDPARAALRLGPHAALLSTQIKYLQRAKTKLPSYHRARCIIPPLAFEQASSEAAAEAKDLRRRTVHRSDLRPGRRLADAVPTIPARRLSGARSGTGARRRYNFERLEAHNIEVICTSAETFVAEFAGTADLIYADPARRDGANRRLVRLEECSPDVRSLMPRLQQIARRIVVKASPLFDTDEAFALFGGEVSVEAVSLHGECKELLIDLPGTDRPEAPGLLRATAIGRGTRTFHPEQLRDGKPDAGFDPPYGFLLVPDVSLYKIRAARCYLQSAGAFAASETGYGFARHLPDDFLGHAYPIEEIVPYRPKALKTLFRTRGIERLNLLKRDFPLDAEQIARATGIRQGGNGMAAFTTVNGQRIAVILSEEGRERGRRL